MGFRLNNPAGDAINKNKIITRTAIRLPFPNGNAMRKRRVKFNNILNYISCGSQLVVNNKSSFFFRVHGSCLPTINSA